MGRMPSPESDLSIVSLVRYADSCEPSHRHRDCPFAVEQQGKLTCHEECRSVIKSLLRRGRIEPATRSQAFDARQLRLSEPPGAPDILWHTSSLFQVVVRAAHSSPIRPDGSLELRRLIDATSALGALGSRGLDSEHIVRLGVASFVKLALALSLGKNSDGRLSNWEYITEWRSIFQRSITGEPSLERYVGAVLDGPVAQYLNSWIAKASVEDVLMWRPPNQNIKLQSVEPSMEDIEVWTWLVDRFTKTYLDKWSLSSLKREYSFVKGSWQPEFSTEVLGERVVAREEIATALADRAMVGRDEIDPAMMNSFVEQASSLLRDGQRTAAAALFNAARSLQPNDLSAKNNYAFCILIDKPEEAKALLLNVLERRIPNPAATWCNLAVAESLVGNADAALEACARAYESDSTSESYLWVQDGEDWVVKFTKPKVWAAHFGAGLELSTGADGDVWATRLKSLTALEQQATSSDPSSAGTNEEDL